MSRVLQGQGWGWEQRGHTKTPLSTCSRSPPTPSPSPELGRAQHLEGGRGRKAQLTQSRAPPGPCLREGD